MTIKEVAEKIGYTTVKKSKVKYKGYDVYECVVEGDEPQEVGYPVYILVKGGKYKISEPKLALEILGEEIKAEEQH